MQVSSLFCVDRKHSLIVFMYALCVLKYIAYRIVMRNGGEEDRVKVIGGKGTTRKTKT
jgi:hypothetical protein